MNPVTLLIIVLVVLILIWLMIRLLSSSFIKTTPTTAFVRTGGLRGASAKPLVVMSGAAWVFGFLHRIKWVTLETMAIEVRHLGEDALVTSDPQYVDLEARFFIKVGGSADTISTAARTIGGEAVDENRVRRLVEPKLNGAVRDIAAGFTLQALLEKRIDFIRSVQERLRPDLAENGLVLESISILTLRPTLQGQFSTDDILGAQVARANAAVIEQALTEKNRLERLGALERARQDAEVEREQLGIEESIERERAERMKNIALVRATEETAARVAQENRREEAERARILADRALQEALLENERMAALLRAGVERAVEIERVLRDQAVALAEEERQTRLAEATAVKLAAAQRQIEADRAREEAMQAALTLIERAVAERQAEIDLINARLEAEKQAIERRSEVELEALRLRQMAEAERDIAVAQADARRTRAEAELEAARLEAQGERERQSAVGLAEVQVALERVRVLEREAEAVRQKLVAEADGERAMAEALSSHDGVAMNMELARLNAEALKAIEIARAEALGEAIAGMKMNLFGDAAMAQRLLQLVTTAQTGQALYDSLPPGARAVIERLSERVGLANGGANGHSGDLLALLVETVEAHPAALDDATTVGDLLDALDDEGQVDPRLRPLLDSPDLRELPARLALALARTWLTRRG